MQRINKPIVLHSRELKDSKNYKLCEKCSGIGWMADDQFTHIEYCRKCSGTGLIKICKYCGKETSFCDCEESKTDEHIEELNNDFYLIPKEIVDTLLS